MGQTKENAGMPILNYTTTVPAARTVGEVQALLAGAGASAIMLQY